jgi:hypothetical protein
MTTFLGNTGSTPTRVLGPLGAFVIQHRMFACCVLEFEHLSLHPARPVPYSSISSEYDRTRALSTRKLGASAMTSGRHLPIQ